MATVADDVLRVTDALARHVGWAPGITTTVEGLVRAVRRYATIQERWCNEEMSDDTTARLERAEQRLQNRITTYAWALPDHDSGPWRVRFDGDPRGYVVTLVAPDDSERSAGSPSQIGVA